MQCITIGWLFNSVHSTVKSILKNDTEDIKGKLGIKLYRNDVEKNGFFEKRLEMEMKCRLLRSYSVFLQICILNIHSHRAYIVSIQISVLDGITCTLVRRLKRLRLRLCLGHFSKIFRFFKNLAPGVARGYAPGHKKICIFPQATPQAFYCTIFALRDAPGVARGYASGHKKICIFPQATPQAFYCTIFALRDGLCKFFMPSGYA
ncbi:hypothetical protein T06_6445 [Trichinella sp. T6]|nr:hypothetical protein T06_6445 [Trichinella sp. T6]